MTIKNAAQTKKTFCRYCHAYCPMEVDVETSEAGTVVTAVRPDTSNSLYGGYTCIKGRQLVEQMYQDERLTTCQKKTRDGFETVSSGQALDEVAAKLRAILSEYGPRAIATYNGTYAFQNSAQLAYSRAWHDAIQSPSYYTSVTIDQPAKVFVGTRHGYWGAGSHFFEDSDVSLILGNNPMVSQYAPPGGVPSVSPFEKLRDAKKRGHTLIAVDPRSTELARRADLHLQIQPGEDSTLLAAMIRLIIDEGLHDKAFCDAHTEGLDALRAAVEPYTLDYASQRTQLPAEQIEKAARLFAAGPRGVALTGTGPEMSEHPNLTQHLVASINSLCGRYYREGDVVPNPGVLAPPSPRRAQALNVPLAWGNGARSRIDESLGELIAMGMMGQVREMPTNLLSDEILTPGEGQVRALIVVGGNPLMAFPNQEKTFEALKSLDLLVCIDAYMSGTAQLADYIFAPKLTLERDDVTLLADPWYEEPYSQYASAVVQTDHDVLEEWEVYWELAQRMGIEVSINGMEFTGPERPSKFDLLRAITQRSRVSLDWLRDHPGGHSFPEHKVTVEGPDEMAGKLQFFPEGVAEDFQAALASRPAPPQYNLRLISSRSKYVLNSSGRNLSLLRKKQGDTNPVMMHPDDMTSLGLREDSLVRVHSSYGAVTGVLKAYDRIKPGVITMHHSWGPLPGPDADTKVREHGANTNRLIDNRANTQRYTGMTRQSAIPVYVTAAEEAAA
ncbi:MAG: molybdopterin-dependent oxidoreductase [Pseudomonadota bacterium]